MDAPSCKNIPPNESLYNKIKAKFVENVDPLKLRHFLPIRISDEDKMLEAYDQGGTTEMAAVFLRRYIQMPNWFDELMTALRNPHINQGHLAKEFEEKRRDVMVVVDVDRMDVDEAGGEEPMEVEIDSSSSTSEESRLDFFKEMVSNFLKYFVNDMRQLQEVLRHFSELSDVVLDYSTYGCLELHFRVDSLRSLYILRKLYEGGALCDAVARGLLSSPRVEKLRREAAEKGLRLGKLRVRLQISDEDFSECERHLLCVDAPLPTGYSAARAFPVEAIPDPEKTPIQQSLDKLTPTFRQFIQAVADLKSGQEELKEVLSWTTEPLAIMVKNCLKQLESTFKLDALLLKDLVKIGLTLLCKAAVSNKKNINTVSVGDGGKLIWNTGVRELMSSFSHPLPEEYSDPMLSTSLELLVSKGWLVELRAASTEGGTKFFVPFPIHRDYIVCYLLPSNIPNIDMSLFLKTDESLSDATDTLLFKYAGIFLPSVCCQSETDVRLPDRSHYFPDLVLLLSSMLANETDESTKEKLQTELEHFNFKSLLDVQVSPDVDQHWRTWKSVAANLGCRHLQLMDISSLSTDEVERKASDMEGALNLQHGNVISLVSKTSEFDLCLVLRLIANLDVLRSNPLKLYKIPETEGQPEVAVGAQGRPRPSSSSDKPESQTAHEPISKKISSPDGDWDVLFHEGVLVVDASGKEDYGSRNSSDWGFTLDMSKYKLSKEQVSLVCRFLPSFDHITRFLFDNTELSAECVRLIVQHLNPHTVKGLSLIGCPVKFDSGPVGFSRLRRLEFLNLENCQISDPDCGTLAKEINSLHNLKEFNIGCNNISHSGFTVLSSALMTKVNIFALRLHGCNLGEAGAGVLSQLLYSLKHLEVLSVWGCGLGDDGVEMLSEPIRVHQNLKRLSIRNNNMSHVSSVKMYKSVAHCKHMQFIDCNESGNLIPGAADMVSASILDMFQSSSSWNHVSLWNCSVGMLSIFDNPSCLQGLSRLTYLCLQKNGLEDDKIRDLSHCIQKNFKYLQHLNLRENFITDKGVEDLINALEDKNYLEDLWLDWNMIGYQGSKALIEKSFELHSMKFLDLSNSHQLSYPEKEILARLVAEPTRDGESFVAERGQLRIKV